MFGRRALAGAVLVSTIVPATLYAVTKSPQRAAAATLPIAVTQPADPILDAMAIPDNAADVGVWSSSFSWPLVSIHAALMPDGTVLTYGSPDGQAVQQARVFDVWNPAKGTGPTSHLTVANGGTVESFCSLAALLPNGDFLVAGGNTPVQASVYNYSSQSSYETGSLHSVRWYGTMTILADGRPFVTGGVAPYVSGVGTGPLNTPAQQQALVDSGQVALTPEVYESGGWVNLDGATSRTAFGPELNHYWYPKQWVAPNGRVFGISGEQLWEVDPTGNGSIKSLGTFKTSPNEGSRPNVGPTATSVMYDTGRILQVGGNGFYNGYVSTSSNQATVFDINGVNADGSTKVTFADTQPMANGRQWANATVLPTGQVFVNGGTRSADNGDPDAVYAGELWNPATGKWTTMASAAEIRNYHSTSILMPNGSVFTSGGGVPGPVANFNAEIFYPPAMFTKSGTHSVRANAPKITGISADQFGYGSSIELSLADTRSISSVSLIGLSSTTHADNMGQRRQTLGFQQNGDRLTISAPGSAALAPPGFYHLSVIDSTGVASSSTIIGIGTDVNGPVSQTGAGSNGGSGNSDATTTTTIPVAVDPGGRTSSSGGGGGNPEAVVVDYVPTNPDRVLDTRAAQIGYQGPKPVAGQTIALHVTNTGTSNIPTTAKAVTLNLTGADPTDNGYVTVWPCGTPQPNASTLNLTTGLTTPNAVTTQIGTGGNICIYTQSGTHLLADIDGYMPANSTFIPTNPDRVLDTRAAQIGYQGPKPVAGQTIALHVTNTGTSNIPTTAKAVTLNLTGADPTDNGYVTVWPCGTPQPNASTLNLTTGLTTPNAVTTQIGTGGNICIYTQSGTHLLADIDGYMPANSTFIPTNPDRVLDTRAAQIGYQGPKPVAGQTIALHVTNTGTSNIPTTAKAVTLNLTGADPTDNGYVTVWPCGTPQPNASTLNLTTGLTTPNAVTTQIGTGGNICIYTQSGTHLLADIDGYWS